MKKLMTAKETAVYLGFRLATIRKWTHLKYIPSVKFRGGVRYDQAKIDTWVENKSHQGRTKLRATRLDMEME